MHISGHNQQSSPCACIWSESTIICLHTYQVIINNCHNQKSSLCKHIWSYPNTSVVSLSLVHTSIIPLYKYLLKTKHCNHQICLTTPTTIQSGVTTATRPLSSWVTWQRHTQSHAKASLPVSFVCSYISVQLSTVPEIAQGYVAKKLVQILQFSWVNPETRQWVTQFTFSKQNAQICSAHICDCTEMKSGKNYQSLW